MWLAILGCATAIALTPGPTAAHSGDVFHAALTIPVTVDGALSPGEWADASMKTFTLCGGVSPGRVFVKNDATYLYVAVEVQNARWQFQGGHGNDFLNVHFDNNHNGVTEVGENSWNVRGGDGLSLDGYNPNGVPGWNFDDTSDGGTDDFVAAVTHTNPVLGGVGTYTIEYKGLLDSADNTHDFSLTPDQTVGFSFTLAAVECSSNRDWPPGGVEGYADIVVAEPPVNVDLEPNVINLASHALSVTAFIEVPGIDPTTIDLPTLRLAGAVPALSKPASVGDHDGNGVSDLMVKFSREALDPLLTPGVNELEVTGSLVTGEEFTGSDEVRVISLPEHPSTSSVAPNPLNPQGVLTFRTMSRGLVAVGMFDVYGRQVRVLLDSQILPAGLHEVRIDGRGSRGERLASGVYIYRVETGEGVVTGRIVILK
jgi:hypothetical protein